MMILVLEGDTALCKGIEKALAMHDRSFSLCDVLPHFKRLLR